MRSKDIIVTLLQGIAVVSGISLVGMELHDVSSMHKLLNTCIHGVDLNSIIENVESIALIGSFIGSMLLHPSER